MTSIAASLSPAAADTLETSRLWRLVAMLAMLAFALTLPRAVLDYGLNGDALDNAGDAMKLVALGPAAAIPQMIRWPPGVPAFIALLAAVVPWGGHLAANLLVFGSFVAALALFAAIARREVNGNGLLLTALFGVTPFLLLNAAVAQDFMPGLAAALAAYLALSRRAYVAAGVLFGLGMGVRVTNVLLLVPAVVYVAQIEREARARARAVVTMGALTAGVGVAFYLPFLYLSGLGWRYFLPLPGHGASIGTGWMTAFYNWVSIFGVVATAGLLAIVAMCRRRLVEGMRHDWRRREPAVLFALMTIGIYALVSFRFTMKAEYAMPAIPFLFLLMGRWLGRRAVIAAIVLVASYAAVALEVKGGVSGRRALTLRPAAGLLVSDWQQRRDVHALRAGLRSLAPLDRVVVLTGMGGVLTSGNDALEPAALTDLSARLPRAAGISEHRGVGTLVHRLRGTSVFLITSLARQHVETLQREGYRVFMFADYAPSTAVHLHGYDPYALGITALPIFGSGAFYRPAGGRS